MTGLPPLYFRIRENGAAVFRIDDDTRDRRMEFELVAVVNTNRGDFKAHGDHVLTAAEETEISEWLNLRMALLEKRKGEDMARLVDQMNLAAQWAQSTATDAQLASVTDDLLLAMHDLRSVLVRKKADRLGKAAGG